MSIRWDSGSLTRGIDQVAPQQPKKAVKQESKFDKAANAAAAQTASKGKKGGLAFPFCIERGTLQLQGPWTRVGDRHHHHGSALSSSCGASPLLRARIAVLAETNVVFPADDTVDCMLPPPKRQKNAHGSGTDWFKDVPWFNVPPEMTGKIVIEALQPPLRLLGGSGKPSKLAALAAARKKKEAEQKAASGQAAESSDEKHDSTAASLLDRLGTRSNRTAPVQSTETPKDVPSASQPAPQRMYPIRKKKSPSPPPPDLPQASPLMEITPNRPEKTQPDLRAGPSVFASAMCGPANSTPNHAIRKPLQENTLSMLYGNSSSFTKSNPFAGPSPDDIVTQAQAKGSTRS